VVVAAGAPWLAELMRAWCASVGLIALSGCVSEQSVAILGEAGLIAWSTTVYYTGDAPTGWEDASFATHQPYTITAVLTDTGTSSILEPHTVTHRLRDADGADAGEVEHLEDLSSSGIPSFRAVPGHAGTIYIEATYQDEVVDVAALTVIAGRVQVDDGVVYGPDDGRW